MPRRRFLKVASVSAASVLLAGSGLAYTHEIEPAWIEVTSLSLNLKRLTPAFAGYRIVQISDIHADNSWMDLARLANVVSQVNAQRPDLIVITGDFVTRNQMEHMQETLSALHDLKARDGVLSVLGNHDHQNDADAIRALLQSNGVHNLDDTFHTLRRGQETLHIAGMDDLFRASQAVDTIPEQVARLQQLTASLPTTGAAILLIHEPDIADLTLRTGRYSLQLSGHSHGGQIRLPLAGPLYLPLYGRKYVIGLYHNGELFHYTSRGLGMVSPHFRLNCRPEITVFTCQPG